MSVMREYESSDCAGDYEEIERAVMESARGRWFLAEFAKRIRAQDTALILDAIHRLESRTHASAAGEALVKPLVSETVDSPEIAASALRYYRQDEDIFAPLPGANPDKPVLRVVEDTNPRVTIRRTASEQEKGIAEATIPERSEPAKPRIVLVRKPASDLLSIPLADETPENAVA
ncbi:MAG: hypothetical protein JNM20_02075 [Rhizobiales bacterium]|nr:hypothetical protein [Hyphomicrobiales bacterium]